MEELDNSRVKKILYESMLFMRRSKVLLNFYLILEALGLRIVFSKFPSPGQIGHVDAILKLMSAITGNREFEEAANSITESERSNTTMVDIVGKFMTKAKREGVKEGRREGELKALLDLVRDNLLTLAQAASRVGMTVREFETAVEKLS